MSQPTEKAQTVEKVALENLPEDNDEADEWYHSLPQRRLAEHQVTVSDEINIGTGGFSVLAALVSPCAFVD